MKAIEIEHYQKIYANGFEAVKDISLSVNEGEFVGLLGVNGAGKSTLINTMAGLVKPTSGVVKIMGYDVTRERENAAMAIGVVPQEVVCDPFLTVSEVLTYQSGYYGIADNRAWIKQLLERLDLADKATSPVRALSGGMKRRVLVAQALVHRPPVIVLDEPTAGVDVTVREKLWQFIRELHQMGHTIVLTTHYLQEAQQMCSRIALIHHGELLADENKDVLLQSVHQKVLSVKTCVKLSEALMARCVAQHDKGYRLSYRDMTDLVDLMQRLNAAGVNERDIAMEPNRLEDVFVRVIENAQKGEG